jgi:hypothetical protein
MMFSVTKQQGTYMKIATHLMMVMTTCDGRPAERRAYLWKYRAITDGPAMKAGVSKL